jgi:FkbM family methyltransferase
MSNGVLVHGLQWLARHSHRVSRSLTRVRSVVIEGQSLRVPITAGTGIQNLTIADHDRALQRAVRNTLALRTGAVLDVGCNIGHFMELCLLADPSRRYVGADPSLACCRYVEQFIRENRLAAHTVLPIGLAEEVGVAELHSNGAFDVCASLCSHAHPEKRYAERQAVVTLPGDAVVEALAPVALALIKIDVEGLELEVLRGLAATLRRDRPLVLFEVLSLRNLPAQGAEVARAFRLERARALAAFFGERDYLLLRLEPDTSLTAVEQLDPASLQHSVQMDHLALPREQAAAFLARYGHPLHSHERCAHRP